MWLLGLLALLFLVFLFSQCGDDDAVVVDDTTVVEEPVVAGPVVEDPAVAATALNLSDLYVTRVTGDRTFFVAPSEADQSRETLVLLDESASPGAPGVEGQVDINPGQRVNLSGGTLSPLGDASLANMGIADADLNAMTPQTDIIRVPGTAVEVIEAPMGVGEVEVGT